MIEEVYKILKKEIKTFDVPVIELVEAQTKDPFKILVSTILSARTKDEVTAKISIRLYKKVKTANDLKKLTVKQIEKLIYPVGFYKTKARHLKLLPEILETEFNSKIPKTIEELIKLPGVGRKTANLVVSVAFKKPAICVDTHCHRIPQRIGWFKSKNPLETEMIFRDMLPKKLWSLTNRIFVPFGQAICRPINPHCWECPIIKYCNYYKNIYKKSEKYSKNKPTGH